MVLLEALVVLGVAGVIIYLIISRFTGQADRRAIPGEAGVWRTAHYSVEGGTRVVVQKVSADGTRVVDEHVIATIEDRDPDYDARFLDAMAQARARLALFQAEEG